MREIGLKTAALMLAASVLTLNSCTLSQLPQIPPDTGATDPDRFVEETNPVWSRPAPQRKRPAWFDVPLWGKATTPEVETLPTSTVTTGYPPARGRLLAPADPDDDLVTGAIPAQDLTHYDPRDDAGHWLPAIPVNEIRPDMLRRTVAWTGDEAPGTIVIDTGRRHLFFVSGDGQAIRYGIGVGRDGESFSGEGVVGRIAAWPQWTPTLTMVDANPTLSLFAAKNNGLVGGLNNPLGARALYLVQDGRETTYRIHGSPDWKSIGQASSSGCIRMFNQDVIDLAGRVKPGARVIVR